ncbi:MAG: response regulator [Desulfotignum sp.]|jgi:response regulator RpfG family c-di-GMP phosphodiesterase|nr:response regulator [Desulfotignum sp.]
MQNISDHTVLIVDDDQIVGKALGHLIKQIGAQSVYVPSGRQALEKITAADPAFSLIISDQQMPEMKGSDLLEKAKEIAPDTIRFLITGYADMDAVTDALNKGAIHRYIAKPWETNTLCDAVKNALEQHAVIMENHRLFTLAKEQNAVLYRLNVALKKDTDRHQKTLLNKQERIAELTARLEKAFDNRDHMQEIQGFLQKWQLLDQTRLHALQSAMASELYRQFADIAARNGFEMPENPGPGC